MKAILLHNWRAKIASLLLAMAIWFLIRLTIQDQIPPEIPVPGTGTPPPGESVTPIPGVPVGGLVPPLRGEAATLARSGFYRLHRFEAGEFAASRVEDSPGAVL